MQKPTKKKHSYHCGQRLTNGCWISINLSPFICFADAGMTIFLGCCPASSSVDRLENTMNKYLRDTQNTGETHKHKPSLTLLWQFDFISRRYILLSFVSALRIMLEVHWKRMMHDADQVQFKVKHGISLETHYQLQESKWASVCVCVSMNLLLSPSPSPSNHHSC